MRRRRGREAKVGLDSGGKSRTLTGLAGRVGLGHGGRNSEESLSYTPFKSHFQQRLSPQGYPGRPPTSSWPVVPLPRPLVDICRFSPLPAKSRCVTHQPPSSQLPATHITAASLHQHSASFISSWTPFLPIVPSLFLPVFLPPFCRLLLILPSALIRWLGPASAYPLRLADVAIVSSQIPPSPSQPTLPPQRRLTLTTVKA